MNSRYNCRALSSFCFCFIALFLIKTRGNYPFKTVSILTWGGLRGGISIALALSLSPELSGNPILHITYMVVLFSIIIQGLSIGKFVKKLYS